MSKADDNPIILGRRNCARCTRWRHATDFRWHWPHKRVTTPEGGRTATRERYNKPKIDKVCNVCRRDIERGRYRENRKDWIHRAVENRRKRDAKRAEERMEARLLVAENRRLQRELVGLGNGNLLPFTPFRMWLIARLRRYDNNESELARRTGIPQSTLQNYLKGYAWPKAEAEVSTHGWCEPQPIYTVHVNIVDRALLGEGTTNLEELYPYEED